MLLLSIETALVIAVGFLGMLLLFAALFQKKDTKSKPIRGTITLPVKVREAIKLSWEASSDNTVQESGSISIPSTEIEEINVLVTEEEDGLTAKMESVRMRSPHHERIVLIENANKKDVYTVPVPPGTKEINLHIEKIDGKISVELK